METLIVQVSGKSEAKFIQKVLQQFKAVKDVLLQQNGSDADAEREAMEMREDVAAYQAAKALNEVPVPYIPIKNRKAANTKM